MGMRFRKSIKIAPGVKLNVGKKSMGISVGNKYGGVSANSRTGVRTRASIPGTGISFSETVSSGKSGKSSAGQADDIETYTTAFDERVLQSLNETAFDDYLQGYLAYAKTISADDPRIEEVRSQIAAIRKEQSRRFNAKEEKEHKANEPSLLLLICGVVSGILGIILLFSSLWGFAFLGSGLLMLLAEYNKK